MMYEMSRRNDTIVLNTETGDISGSTYAMKDVIKSDLYASWDADRRVWHNDNLAEVITKYGTYLTRLYKLAEKKTAPATTTKRMAYNGLCPRCHTYCDGDCTSR